MRLNKCWFVRLGYTQSICYVLCTWNNNKKGCSNNKTNLFTKQIERIAAIVWASETNEKNYKSTGRLKIYSMSELEGRGGSRAIITIDCLWSIFFLFEATVCFNSPQVTCYVTTKSIGIYNGADFMVASFLLFKWKHTKHLSTFTNKSNFFYK